MDPTPEMGGAVRKDSGTVEKRVLTEGALEGAAPQP